MSNRSILAITYSSPTTFQGIEKLGVLSRAQLEMYVRKLAASVKAARALAESDLPVYPRKRSPRLPADAATRGKALQEWRNQKAETLAMDPGILCDKAVITSISAKNPDSIEALGAIEEMKNWQRDSLGPEIIYVLKQIPGKKPGRKKKKK